MAEVPVRRDRSPERPMMRRNEWFPGFGHLASGEYLPWSPWSLMRRFQEMERWLHGSESDEMAMWSPSIDVRERDHHLIVSADLPGLTKDDVKVEVTDEGLSIRGERKREYEERQEGYYRTERSYGSFRRVIPLPEGASVEQAKALFKDGVLEVTVPIPESARRRREIPIEGAPKTRTSGGGV